MNGLQTTETIHQHFQAGSNVSRDRALLVKIIVSSDKQARDQIIRATNNQSPVEVAALHATDKIQRDIEDILERHDWYYERRRNYYRNIGKPLIRFVMPLYLASSVVALIFKNPSKATRLKSKFMRNKIAYDAVFSGTYPIEIWPALVNVYKQVDAGLAAVAGNKKSKDKFVRNWRALVSLILVARRLKTFSYTPAQLIEASQSAITKAEVAEVWSVVIDVVKNPVWTGKTQGLTLKACARAADLFGLLGVKLVGRRDIPAHQTDVGLRPISSEFLREVERLLPDQPWEVGIHIEIASKLERKAIDVSRAIQQLIDEGKRNPQRDGVVYDAAGRVLAVDPERIPLTVDELNTEQDRMGPETEYR